MWWISQGWTENQEPKSEDIKIHIVMIQLIYNIVYQAPFCPKCSLNTHDTDWKLCLLLALRDISYPPKIYLLFPLRIGKEYKKIGSTWFFWWFYYASSHSISLCFCFYHRLCLPLNLNDSQSRGRYWNGYSQSLKSMKEMNKYNFLFLKLALTDQHETTFAVS